MSKDVHVHSEGILPVQSLRQLVDAGMVTHEEEFPFEEDQFQPNSIDLRLGRVAHRVRCSFLPEDETVPEKVERLRQYSFSIEDGAVLEPNCVYIIPLLEGLNLPEHSVSRQQHLFPDAPLSMISGPESPYLSARANPKSTTGRLDIFTRVIANYSHRFEEIQSGYQGPLWLEVVPKSFPIRVRTGHRLNQLRIRHGYHELDDEALIQTHERDPLLFDASGIPLDSEALRVNQGLFLSVNLIPGSDRDGIIGYKARNHRDLIDLDKTHHYDVGDYWEPIQSRDGDPVILEPEAFYIFASRERCRIPAHLAAEMIAYDTGSGELRTHYAGFFDSGFGGSVEDGGARAVLEVRSHDVPFMIEHGQTFCSMKFETNSERPEFVYGHEIQSNYQGQGLKLGKHFKQP
ncbi:MAG: 2'-deoxycytidine 5'-triphosphate deaminase [Balneolaceae bacterium]